VWQEIALGFIGNLMMGVISQAMFEDDYTCRIGVAPAAF
jgi:hypothetical protein